MQVWEYVCDMTCGMDIIIDIRLIIIEEYLGEDFLHELAELSII